MFAFYVRKDCLYWDEMETDRRTWHLRLFFTKLNPLMHNPESERRTYVFKEVEKKEKRIYFNIKKGVNHIDGRKPLWLFEAYPKFVGVNSLFSLNISNIIFQVTKNSFIKLCLTLLYKHCRNSIRWETRTF